MGELFSCSPVKNYIRIRTPYLYPDGDVIDVFLKDDDGTLVLSDLGETVRWLRGQTTTVARRTAKQQQLIQDICLTHGVEFFCGMLQVRTAIGSIAPDVTRLAQSCLRVADIWFTFRLRSMQSTVDDVADFLLERNVKFARGATLAGRSGRPWTIDFHAHLPTQTSLVQVLTTGSRGATRVIADHVLAGWYDLSQLKTGPESPKFISLFDDTVDVWPQDSFNLLGEISEVVRWSRPDEFFGAISA